MPALLNHGIYDPTEISRLLRLDPETLARWSTRWRRKAPLVEPTFGDIFSFHDLVSLAVVQELWHRGVDRDDIHRGIEMLRQELSTDRPLAHRGLATVGRSFFAHVGEWVDAGRGGQGAFQAFIEPFLRPISYDALGMAAIWRPHTDVWLNPRVQAGTPCIDATRVPTLVIAGLVKEGETPDEIAEDLELELDHVLEALDFEQRLEEAPISAAAV